MEGESGGDRESVREDGRGEAKLAVELWIWEPLVLNLHHTLHWLLGNFPAGLLAAYKTPT